MNAMNAMKVKDLIESLSKMNPEGIVVVGDYSEIAMSDAMAVEKLEERKASYRFSGNPQLFNFDPSGALDTVLIE